MSSVEHHFGRIKPYAGHEHSTAANGQHLSISGIGSICLTTPQNQSFPLSSIPKFSANLLSVGQLVDHGYLVAFSSTGSVIQDQQTGKVIGDRT